MKQHLAYLRAVLRHKWFVFWQCLRMGVPIWWAVIHDWDKFTPAMWSPYVAYFYSPRGIARRQTPDEKAAFDRAWNGHQKLNKHHWQYWVLMEDSGKVIELPMPDRHRREMVADWVGAGKAYNKDWTPLEPRKWYQKNKDKMRLHPDTRAWVEATLERLECTGMDALRGEWAPRWSIRDRDEDAAGDAR